MLDTNLLAGVSAITSAGIAVISMWNINKVMMSNFKESLQKMENKLDSSLIAFRVDIKENIREEKRHAMEVAESKIFVLKKDIDDLCFKYKTLEEKL